MPANKYMIMLVREAGGMDLPPSLSPPRSFPPSGSLTPLSPPTPLAPQEAIANRTRRTLDIDMDDLNAVRAAGRGGGGPSFPPLYGFWSPPSLLPP